MQTTTPAPHDASGRTNPGNAVAPVTASTPAGASSAATDTNFATLTKGTMVAVITGTGLLVETDTRDGWTATVEHDGTSDDALAALVADGYQVQA